MFRRARTALAIGAVALAALTACGGPAAPGGPAPSSSAGLHTASTTLGTIVVNGEGMTLYFFDKDTPNATSSACTGPCIALWPAVTTTETTPAIAGVTGTVSTITGADGVKQVTLNGLPLYSYAGDKKAGDTNGQGYQNIWWVIDAQGAKVTSTPPTSSGYGGMGY